MKTYCYLLLVGFLFFVSMNVTASPKLGDRPNVVVILSDDQGFGDLSLHGNKDLKTPHIDSIGKDGAVFQNFYVCPVCSPTRAEFLTGRYTFRGGVYSTSAGGERLDLDEVTIADTFKKAGYKTGAFGKWHNGMQYPYHPNGRGFDEYYGFASGHWGNYFDAMMEHNGKIVKGEGFMVDDLTTRAIDFIEKHKQEPFFVYLPLNTPHSPMQVPDRFWNKFKGKDFQMKHPDNFRKKKDPDFIRAALAMCENIDWNVGRLLKKLDETGLAKNTIVLYFSDNGPNSDRWNLEMRGRKGSTDEGGTRSPLVMRWPAKIPKGTVVEQLSGGIDLLPTLASMANVPLISKKKLDGIDVKEYLLGGNPLMRDRVLLSHWRNKVSVRVPGYRLDHVGRLYDVNKSRAQVNDLSKKMPQLHKRLRGYQFKFQDEIKRELPKQDLRGFLIGHPEAVYTQLPARDAKVSGKLKRSNRFPNCSYFTNWVNTDDMIMFDVEVVADGVFEVEMYYTCPKDSVGSVVELAVGANKVKAKITEAHDPPLRGMDEDRVKRMESYVKDFKALKMGKLKLQKGKGRITLRAVEMPGKSVGEFRMLMLKRVK